MGRLVSLAIAVVVALALLSSTLFTVRQNHYAVVYALGEFREVIKEPGLHAKMPPPFQNVVLLDGRLQTLDTGDGTHFPTLEKKDVLVDAFVKWKIVNPRQYLVAVNNNVDRGGERLAQAVRNALNAEIGKRNLRDVVATQREQIGAAVLQAVAREARDLGVDVADVRIKRIEFPGPVNAAVFERMKAERIRVANEIRATGAAEAEQIRADAERQRSVIVADAQRQAETVKGEGDAKASQVYAQSFGKNPEFYRFWRSLEAYRATFKSRNDVLVLDSNSEFFKYFKGPGK
jgi:membrane protease subunit HflC